MISTSTRAPPGNAHHEALDLAPLAAQLCREFVPAALARDMDLGYEGGSNRSR
ncbi:MAG: hypothetical protein R3310_05160 [Candidatus Competibacteraceae bacterium]|nr:hypothetical protein [Candidatus Competibacteraceae bacterium]